MIKKAAIGLAMTLLLLVSNSAWASDPNGTWISSSGSTIKLWANMQQVNVTVITPQGQTFKYNGWWTRFSDYFAYQTNNGTNYGSFTNSNTIKVKDPAGKWYTWTRANSAQAPIKQTSPSYTSIDGNWQSSSGAMVQVSSQGQQISVMIIGTNGKRNQGIGRWIKKGYQFDYSIAGFKGVAICTILNSNKIKVVFSGKPTYWTR